MAARLPTRWDTAKVSWDPAVRLLLLVLLVPATGACVPVRNLVADRDLGCRETPDDVCMRVAELGLTRLDVAQAEREVGPIPTIQVYPVRCTEAELGVRVPDATRCWMVEATNEGGGIGVGVVERVDGSLAIP